MAGTQGVARILRVITRPKVQNAENLTLIQMPLNSSSVESRQKKESFLGRYMNRGGGGGGGGWGGEKKGRGNKLYFSH